MSADEEVNVELLTRPDEQLQREDRIFRKAVNFELFSRDIWGLCQRCGTENNLTKKKTLFCDNCGAMIHDRYHKAKTGNRIFRFVEHQ